MVGRGYQWKEFVASVMVTNTFLPIFTKTLAVQREDKLMGANSGVESKAETTNPKDLIGNTKVSITKLPQVAIVHGAMAMMDGAKKYGPYNWRAKKVVASIYIDAAMRHLAIWFEGQETASDSKVHHLGHAIACCAILLDAQATGNLVDDRPITEGVDPEWFEKLMGKLSDTIKEKNGSPSK
jgi:hypothetical protein